jgi:hypothetical protein
VPVRCRIHAHSSRMANSDPPKPVLHTDQCVQTAVSHIIHVHSGTDCSYTVRSVAYVELWRVENHAVSQVMHSAAERDGFCSLASWEALLQPYTGDSLP